jgi:hypothetical protein
MSLSWPGKQDLLEAGLDYYLRAVLVMSFSDGVSHQAQLEFIAPRERSGADHLVTAPLWHSPTAAVLGFVQTATVVPSCGAGPSFQGPVRARKPFKSTRLWTRTGFKIGKSKRFRDGHAASGVLGTVVDPGARMDANARYVFVPVWCPPCAEREVGARGERSGRVVRGRGD